MSDGARCLKRDQRRSSKAHPRVSLPSGNMRRSIGCLSRADLFSSSVCRSSRRRRKRRYVICSMTSRGFEMPPDQKAFQIASILFLMSPVSTIQPLSFESRAIVSEAPGPPAPRRGRSRGNVLRIQEYAKASAGRQRRPGPGEFGGRTMTKQDAAARWSTTLTIYRAAVACAAILAAGCQTTTSERTTPAPAPPVRLLDAGHLELPANCAVPTGQPYRLSYLVGVDGRAGNPDAIS